MAVPEEVDRLQRDDIVGTPGGLLVQDFGNGHHSGWHLGKGSSQRSLCVNDSDGSVSISSQLSGLGAYC